MTYLAVDLYDAPGIAGPGSWPLTGIDPGSAHFR